MLKVEDKAIEQRKPQDLALLMNEETFESWMESIIPQMVQLSLKQTEAFFLQFLERCTWEQKLFLENEFSSLLKQDFMMLPDLIVNKILKMLDVQSILNLRLVCLSWKEKIASMTRFWKAKCQQCLFLSDDNWRSCLAPYSVEFFLQSQRSLRQITTGKGCHVKTHVLRATNTVASSVGKDRFEWFPKVPHLLCYCPVNNIIVAGAFDLHLTAVDAQTEKTLWVSWSSIPSCLHISSDLLLAGNHFGQVKVLSLQGDLLDNGFQCGACSVSTLDVHPSGLFMIVATADRCLHLVDNEWEVYNVIWVPEVLMPVSPVRKVFFLPDACLEENQLAVYACTDYWSFVALLDRSGRVLKQETRQFSHKVFSFCRDSNESNVLYTATDVSANPPPPPSMITKYSFQVSSEGVSSQAMDICIKFGVSDNVLLLAVGKELGIAAVGESVYAFRMSHDTVLFSFPDFLDGKSVTNLALRAETGRVVAANVDWLNGLMPRSMQTDRPLLFFSSSAPHTNGTKPVIKSLCWSPDLWGSFSWRLETIEPLVDSTCCDTDMLCSVDVHASSAVGTEGGCCQPQDVEEDERFSTATTLPNYRMCSPLGVWRNAALFKQKMKKKQPVSSICGSHFKVLCFGSD